VGWVQRSRGRWRAEWRDPRGRKRSKTFDRKADATRYLATQATAIARGDYVDPMLGKATLESFWPRFQSSARNLRPSTQATYEAIARVHILPQLGARPLGRLPASMSRTGYKASRRPAWAPRPPTPPIASFAAFCKPPVTRASSRATPPQV
jgi:hypothetical protein